MKKIIVSIGALALPMFAYASTGPQLSNIETLINSIARLIGQLLPIVVALALLYFFWGLAQFILSSGGDEKAKEVGKSRMIWGIVTLFVMVSVWGLVGFIGRALNINQGENSSNIPKVTGLPSR